MIHTTFVIDDHLHRNNIRDEITINELDRHLLTDFNHTMCIKVNNVVLCTYQLIECLQKKEF